MALEFREAGIPHHLIMQLFLRNQKISGLFVIHICSGCHKTFHCCLFKIQHGYYNSYNSASIVIYCLFNIHYCLIPFHHNYNFVKKKSLTFEPVYYKSIRGFGTKVHMFGFFVLIYLTRIWGTIVLIRVQNNHWRVIMNI